jgi:EmrB/QacA subfamily drug resistance transporter
VTVDEPIAARSASRAWLVVAAMALVNLLVALDFLGTSVLLPDIAHRFQAGTDTLAWITNAYLLTLAAPLVAAGRIADVLGRKRLAVGGLVGFAVASTGAGLAPSAELLILARGVQGLAAAALTATGLSIVAGAFPAARRGPAVGAWAAVGAVGSAAGPVVAGVVAEVWSWRGFFLLNVPLACVALVAIVLLVEPDRPAAPGRAPRPAVGWASIGALTLGIGLLVVALLQAPEWGWSSPGVLGAAIGAGFVLAWFVRRERASTAPIVDASVFRSRSYAGTATVAFVANIAFAAATFFVSLYLQQVRDLSPGATGAAFLALTIPLMIASPVVGVLTERIGPGPLMSVGLVLLAASFAVLSRLGLGPTPALVGIGLVLSGLGQGLAFNVSNVAGMDAIDPARAGLASGMINGIRQLGSLFGLAITEALFAVLRDSASGSAAETFVAALAPTMLLVAAVCLLAVIPARWARGAPVRGAPAG